MYQYIMALGPVLATGLFWIFWPLIAGRRKKRAAQIAPVRPICDHSDIVPVRNNGFGLVATLCTKCFQQLGPEVWESKMDRELAELEPPAKQEPIVLKRPPKPVYLNVQADLEPYKLSLEERVGEMIAFAAPEAAVRETFRVPQPAQSETGQVGNMGSRFEEMARHLGIPYDPYESAANFARRSREAMGEMK